MKCPECERTGQQSKLFMPDGYSSTMRDDQDQIRCRQCGTYFNLINILQDQYTQVEIMCKCGAPHIRWYGR